MLLGKGLRFEPPPPSLPHSKGIGNSAFSHLTWSIFCYMPSKFFVLLWVLCIDPISQQIKVKYNGWINIIGGQLDR
jgi:hypothetical protein